MRQGILELLGGLTTVGSCLAVIALPNLKKNGFIPLDFIPHFEDGELSLYRLLGKDGGDAYSRYNALLRQLVSFERAIKRGGLGNA